MFSTLSIVFAGTMSTIYVCKAFSFLFQYYMSLYSISEMLIYIPYSALFMCMCLKKALFCYLFGDSTIYAALLCLCLHASLIMREVPGISICENVLYTSSIICEIFNKFYISNICHVRYISTFTIAFLFQI